VPLLERERDGHIEFVRLNSPKTMNALSTALCAALDGLAAEIEADVSIRCVIFTGSGRAFCAGADLKERKTLGPVERWTYVVNLNRTLRRLDSLPVPVITAVNGYALGGGLELALIGDYRIAVEDAEIGSPEARWGIIPGGGIVRLVRECGPSIAALLSFTAERYKASTAQGWGIFHEVVSDETSLEAQARAVAKRIGANAPLALRAAKRLVRGVDEAFMANAMNLAMEIRAPLDATEDCSEGLAAFAARRPPNFRGR